MYTTKRDFIRIDERLEITPRIIKYTFVKLYDSLALVILILFLSVRGAQGSSQVELMLFKFQTADLPS